MIYIHTYNTDTKTYLLKKLSHALGVVLCLAFDTAHIISLTKNTWCHFDMCTNIADDGLTFGREPEINNVSWVVVDYEDFVYRTTPPTN